MKRHVFPLLAFLAACGTPQEQCIQRNTRDLRTVDRLIAETQGNLDRGYALEEVTITQERWGYCREPVPEGQPALPPVPCLIEHDIRVERAKAIDLADEAKKLEGLKAKRRELAKAAEAVIAQCKAEFPE
ncbi:MAG TPA: hypothetical protein PKA03_03930 [Tabrizicola sp.]|nr:hypothetical protein [Tabrizicola sp.]